MKVKHLLLGLAIVALMASCGKKAETTSTQTETPVQTETAAPATPTETVAEQPATPAPAEKQVPAKKDSKKAKKDTKTTAKAKTDPCEAKVKAIEKYADELNAAKKGKNNGAIALAKYTKLKGEAASQIAAAKSCAANADYQTRVQNAILLINKTK